ncbi:MAG: alpha/beta fold hydrolase [Aeromicrobium sp.]
MLTTRSADGITLAGDRRDPTGASRGTVFLLHGSGQTRHSWQRTAQALAAAGWSACSFDARGHGDSDWAPPHGSYSLGSLVDDLLAHVATHGPVDALVGASLGGSTALAALGENPGLARACVVVDMTTQVDREGASGIWTFMTSAVKGFASLEEASDRIAAYNPHRARPRALDGLRKNLRERDGRWFWHWDPAFMTGPRSIVEGFGTDEADTRIAVAAALIEVPVLLTHGAHSNVVSPGGIAHMRSVIPHLEIDDPVDGGHMIVGDDNHRFATGLLAFLDRTVPVSM